MKLESALCANDPFWWPDLQLVHHMANLDMAVERHFFSRDGIKYFDHSHFLDPEPGPEPERFDKAFRC